MKRATRAKRRGRREKWQRYTNVLQGNLVDLHCLCRAKFTPTKVKLACGTRIEWLQTGFWRTQWYYTRFNPYCEGFKLTEPKPAIQAVRCMIPLDVTPGVLELLAKKWRYDALTPNEKMRARVSEIRFGDLDFMRSQRDRYRIL